MEKVVLITGASSGIGVGIARELAAAGNSVMLGARRTDRLEAVADELRSAGGKVKTCQLDVTNLGSVGAFVEKAQREFGRVDVIVNNAGVMPLSPMASLKIDEWEQMIDVNIKGVLYGIAAVLPHMNERGSGHIINIASIGGKHGAPSQAHYSASKAAVMGFTRVLAQEVGVDGITANCVCPGIILTDMGRVNLDDPDVRKSWQDKTAMRRIGDPEDVVGAVAFFASNDAAFVTGQTLNVDGGIVLS